MPDNGHRLYAPPITKLGRVYIFIMALLYWVTFTSAMCVRVCIHGWNRGKACLSALCDSWPAGESFSPLLASADAGKDIDPCGVVNDNVLSTANRGHNLFLLLKKNALPFRSEELST
jgi:hypothetical protein